MAFGIVAVLSQNDAQGAQVEVLTLRGAGSSIGVGIRETTAEEAQKAKLASAEGVVIESVNADSPASRAGFQVGDIVLEFDGERVRSVRQFTRLVQETPPRRSVAAIVLRGGSKQTLRVEPEAAGALATDRLRALEDRARGLRRLERPQLDALRNFNFNIAPDLLSRGGAGALMLGISVTSLTPQLAEYFGVKEGALVASVGAGTPAADAGLRAGDVITAVAGQATATPADVVAALRRVQPGEGVDISVTRERKSLMLKATIPARPAASGRGGLPI
jgi:serine protease Do